MLSDWTYNSTSISSDLLFFAPRAMTGVDVAGSSVAMAVFIRRTSSSTPPSSVVTSETCKRKCADDDAGLLSNSVTESQLTKRQKSVTYCNKSNAGGSRKYFPRDESIDEGSNGPQWIESPVRQNIYVNDQKFDQLPFQGHQSAVNTNNTTYASKLSASLTWKKAPTRCSSLSADVAVPLQTTKESKVAQMETVNVLHRKRHFMYTPGDVMKEKMKKYVHDVYRLFDLVSSEDDCWLHPSPPRARGNGRPSGTIPCDFHWTDSSGSHRLRVNVGFVALIVERQLTKEQMKGYVNESWHLSHLCGNWTCCNWRHMTVESGRINSSRNKCFRSVGRCSHEPPCMKHRKRQFLVTLDISNHIKSAVKFVSSDETATAGFQSSDFTDTVWDCGICGKHTLFCGSRTICHSLTSITDSRETLEKLELCSQSNDEVDEAIKYLRNIIADLSREKGASKKTALERWLLNME